MAVLDPARVRRGRAYGCETLDRLLDGARAHRSQVLVLCGEAGIGNTTLLDYVEARASGCHLARATDIEPEMELSFASLPQLSAPMLDTVEHLPGPQREALDIAFGVGSGTAPDRFRVSVAALGLVASCDENNRWSALAMTPSGNPLAPQEISRAATDVGRAGRSSRFPQSQPTLS